MEALSLCNHVSTLNAPLPRYRCVWNKKTKISCTFSVKASSDVDPLLQSALQAATLRFQETHRPEPLFHDPYVACLVPPNISINVRQQPHPYCINTRFIDDKLLQILRQTDDLKQVVLLTDGADTRAYRLTWPSSTLIFDLSAGWIYSELSQKLKDVGAQITKNSLLIHVPMESPNLTEVLQKRGINGSRPSIWVLQGLPLTTLADFEDVLLTVGTLAMKDSILLGEVPACLLETDEDQEGTGKEWIHKFFLSHGFQVQVIDFANIAGSLGFELSRDTSNSILFLAEHLRFSNDQIETWRREFQRVEEDCDEDGFEDL